VIESATTPRRCSDCGKQLWASEQGRRERCEFWTEAAQEAYADRVAAEPAIDGSDSFDPNSGFITVLGDAYVEPASGGSYRVYGRASGATLCDVANEVALDALGDESLVIWLGEWEACFQGRFDRWSIWHGHGVVWASTSDVEQARHAVVLMTRFIEAIELAEAAGTVHRPSPPESLLVPSYEPPPVTSRPYYGETLAGSLARGFSDGFFSFFGGRHR
jgi:hypothetical protein